MTRVVDDELNDAIESARSREHTLAGEPQRFKRETVEGIVRNVLEELPDYWSVREVLEKLRGGE